MPWAFIGTIFSTVFGWWTKRKVKNNNAEKQLAKLSQKMDSLSEKHAKLNFRYKELKELMLKEPKDP